MPAKDEIPSTLRRSPQHAQDVYAAALDSANETYGPGERAHRTAFAAVKHEYEKVGDHWEAKGSAGPSDEGAACTRGSGETQGGVDANATKEHLLEVARRLDVHGRSTMDKGELVEAIKKANDRATAAARKD
ncbi:ChaB family protein [Curtobacterium citreum]|uniref:ChaB family protein n=1 Tax=Curtobacterium citreum TaxID=2036 RepID=UPI0025436687|nr:ChaB family protein [Curtobacterium citreum]WIJ46830.1 ChaB family protein [Curtobacterium citreum]